MWIVQLLHSFSLSFSDSFFLSLPPSPSQATMKVQFTHFSLPSPCSLRLFLPSLSWNLSSIRGGRSRTEKNTIRIISQTFLGISLNEIKRKKHNYINNRWNTLTSKLSNYWNLKLFNSFSLTLDNYFHSLGHITLSRFIANAVASWCSYPGHFATDSVVSLTIRSTNWAWQGTGPSGLSGGVVMSTGPLAVL